MQTDSVAVDNRVNPSDRQRQLRREEIDVLLRPFVARRHQPRVNQNPQSGEWDNTIAVCAIMKQERLSDIREWLLYHRYVFLSSSSSAASCVPRDDLFQLTLVRTAGIRCHAQVGCIRVRVLLV
jgi:hypothetical protein